jgi:hypothetical protein
MEFNFLNLKLYFYNETRTSNSILESSEKSDEAFLEVSGIFTETPSNSINIRINQKKKQLEKKTITGLNILISVVEFSTPKAKIIQL